MARHLALGQIVRMKSIAGRMVHGWAQVPNDTPEEAIDLADGEASVIAGPIHINDRIGSVYRLATASGPIWVPAGMIS